MARSLFVDSPFLLGFEHMQALIDRASKVSAEGYPPYNVEDVGDGRLRITLAVAGFCAAQLKVAVEGAQLVVSGRRDAEVRSGEDDRAFLHRGIATRAFTRAFVLADGVEVADASLQDGLLHIDLTRPRAERAALNIPIRTAP